MATICSRFPSALRAVIRGTTVQFSTIFYDVDDDVIQPDSATINILFMTQAGQSGSASVPMAPPTTPATNWTALWDTRGLFAPQIVSWSIHTGTGDPIPVAVDDGAFELVANAANLPTF